MLLQLQLLLLFTVLLINQSLNGQITVTSGLTPNQYVGYLVGSGITYSNVTYSCSNNAIGYFSTGATATNLGFPNGIILSTGRVNGTPAIGSAASNFVSSATNCGGDAQLQSLIPSYSVTEATVLQFDFIPISDTIKFEYVFGSEEYHEWVNTSYNDVFGFFLTGPNPAGGNYTNKNIALIPGSSVPVAINTVNNGNTSNACSSGPCENCTFFVDNCNQSGVVFDAFTGVLTAWAVVTPCQTYHIKLAIGDAGDRIYDSGVFFKEHSFSSPTLSYSASYPMASSLGSYSLEGGCNSASVTFSLPNAQSSDYIVHYTLGGTATNGIDYTFPSTATIPAGSTSVTLTLDAILDAVAEGQETVILTIQTSACNFETLTLYIRDYVNLALSHPSNPSICAGNSANISVNVANGQAPFTYQWSNGATTSTQAVTPATTTNYAVTVTDLCGKTASSQVTVTVNPLPVISINASDPVICQGESSTLTAVSNISGTNFAWNTGSTGSSITVAPTANTVYTVTGTSPLGCTNVANYTVTVSPNPLITVTPQSSGFCAGGSVSLSASGGVSYVWSPSSSLNNSSGVTVVATPTATTTYIVTGTDANGCTSTANAVVEVFPQPNVSAGPDNTICQGSSAQLTGSGAVIYSWSPTATLSNPNIANPVATPSTTTTYILTGYSLGNNVIYNGNFENGNTGFSTNYNYSSNLFPEGNYYISNNPNLQHSNFSACNDHTPAPGTQMMVVNGAPIAGQNVWCQTVAVVPNTTYAFSTWITSVHPSNPAILQFSVNGALLGSPFTAPGTPCTWLQFYQTWYSGALTSVDICIVNQNIIHNGNDFALDDISFAPMCYNVDSVTIFVNPNPVLTVNPATICSGQSTILSVNSSVPGTTYHWNNGATGNTITVNPLTTTTYSVTGTAAGCTGSASAMVTVNPSPILTINTSSNSICNGASANIGVSSSIPGTTYLWSNGSTGSSITVTPGTTATYSVTGTSAAGCSTSGSVTITVNPLPVVTLSASDNIICNGESVTISAGSNIPGSTYLWNTGATSSSISVSPSSTTNYTVTVTSPAGCTATAQTTVTVFPLPVLTIVSGANSICDGASANINVSSNIAGTTFLWSNGSAGSTIIVNPNTTTTYSVTGTSANGCTSVASTTITVNPVPTLTITNSSPFICLGETSTLTVNSSVSGSLFHWSNGATTSSITVSPTSSTIYMVTATSPEGCIGTAQTSVVVRPLPSLSITSSASEICNGASATLNVTSGIPGTTFLWSTGSTLPSINVNPSTTTTYTVTGTSPQGCIGNTSSSIIVNPLPIIALNVTDNIICVGESTTLSATSDIPGSTYSWSNGANTSLIVVSPASTANYSVTVTSPESCVSTVQTTITVNPLPVLTVSSSASAICIGASASLNVYSSIPGTIFLWSNGSSSSSIIVSPGSSTTYTVTGTSPEGCTSIASGTITVNPLPIVALNTTGNIICNGESTSISATSNLAGSAYLWSTGATASSITISPSSNSTYSLTVISPEGCTNTAQTTITVNPLPVLMLTTSANEICNGASASISVSSNIAGTTFLWSNGQTSSTINVNPGTTTTYSVTGTSPVGCISVQSIEITVNPLPVIAMTVSDNEICNGETVTVNASSDIAGSAFLWNNGSTNSSITVSPTATTLYSLTVTSPDGCTSSTQTTIIVNPLPILSLTASSPVICNNESTILSISADIAGSGFVWSNGSVDHSLTVNPSNSSTYSVTGTSPEGCTSSASIFITVNPLPQINIINSAPAICLGDSSTISANSDIPGVTYSWSNGSTASSFTVTPNSSTIYFLTVTSPQGCISTAQTSVVVRPLPSLTITTSGNEICNGASANISVSSNLPNTDFLWNNGSVSSNISVTPGITTTYNVTATSDQGCASSASAIITVNPLPNINVSATDAEICVGEGSILSAVSDIAGSAFAWSNGANTATQNVNPVTTTSYVVTATSPEGCISTAQLSIIVNPLPILSITSSATEICNGASAEINISSNIPGTTYTWSNGATASVVAVSPNSSTLYNVTGTSPEGCYSIASLNITVNPLPIVTLTTNDNEICRGETVTLVAASDIPGSTYLWSNGSPNSSIDVTPSSTSSYTVTVTSPEGCISTALMDIAVNPLPVLNISSSTNEICNGASAEININSNIPGTTFAWSNGSTADHLTVSPSTTNIFSVTGTSPDGCISSSSIEIIVNPLPLVNIATSDHSICNGLSVSLGATADIAGSVFEWSTGAHTAQISVNPSVTTNYLVTVTSPEGCITTSNSEITVFQNPVVTIIPSSGAVCVGTSATLSIQTNIPVTQVLWSNAATTPAIDVSPGLTTTYTVTVTTANGCTGTASFSLQVNELPQISITSQNPEICIGSGIALTVNSNQTLSSVIWSTEETNTSIYVSPAVTTTYSVTATDINGCVSDSDFELIVNPKPIVHITPNQPNICEGMSIQLEASSNIVGTTFTWSNGANGNPITVQPSTTTTYNVTGTSPKGCTGTARATVQVNPLPTMSVNPSQAWICPGDTVQISVSSPDNMTFEWSTGNDGSYIIVSPAQSTNYSVTGTNSFGCIISTSLLINVRNSPVITVVPQNPKICEGDNVDLTASGAVLYDWSPSGGLNTAVGPVVTASPATTTTYLVQGTDLYGCQGTSEITVVVAPVPNINFTASETNICKMTVVHFTGSCDLGVASWQWDFGDPATGIANGSVYQNPIHTYFETGSYTVGLTVTTTEGCVKNIKKPSFINVHPNPIANFVRTPDITTMENPTIHFFNQSLGATKFLWNFDDPESGYNNISISENPTHVYNTEGEYWATLYTENEWGCVDSISNRIIINPKWQEYIPTAFTPNGDGDNDIFRPYGFNIDYSDYTMYIYDRWGKQIFETHDLNVGWNGKVNGHEEVVQQDVYVYLIVLRDITGLEHQFIGHITLIK